MTTHRGDSGQIYTMEGITAAIIILGILFFVIQANSLVVPQTEKSIDMKLGQTANDVLTTMDWNAGSVWSPVGSIKSYVVSWNGEAATYTKPIADPALQGLNGSIASMLPKDVKFNMEFIYSIHYANGTVADHHDMVIINGEPGDNSMVSTRLVTINQEDVPLSSFWSGIDDTYPQIVEVKITCWHL